MGVILRSRAYYNTTNSGQIDKLSEIYTQSRVLKSSRSPSRLMLGVGRPRWVIKSLYIIMVKKLKGNNELGKKNKETTCGSPQFPYSTKPKSLRKFLEMAPKKPKPPKITTTTLKGWGFRDANDTSILRVLKELQLLSSGGEPTDYYLAFMARDTGPETLGKRIKIVYEKLFQNVTSPEKASNEELQNFFNIHSGGSEKTMKYQIETFKALVDHASFNDVGSGLERPEPSIGKIPSASGSKREPDIRIDLHIHLPEGGSKTDYESIIENIAKHLYGRDHE